MIGKYFWDGSMYIGKRCRTMLNSCVYYYFSYGVIFIVFSWSFVSVDNFVCASVDYLTNRIGFENLLSLFKKNSTFPICHKGKWFPFHSLFYFYCFEIHLENNNSKETNNLDHLSRKNIQTKYVTSRGKKPIEWHIRK